MQKIMQLIKLSLKKILQYKKYLFNGVIKKKYLKNMKYIFKMKKVLIINKNLQLFYLIIILLTNLGTW